MGRSKNESPMEWWIDVRKAAREARDRPCTVLYVGDRTYHAKGHTDAWGVWRYTVRHGWKRAAFHHWREPHGHRGDSASYDYMHENWTRVYRISKCWKDQRGKGRSKRNHQYRDAASQLDWQT